jgi:Family of unknown function (DUF5641)
VGNKEEKMTKETELDPLDILKKSKARHLHSFRKAPWWGGWWERMVGLVKNLLKKGIGRTSLYSDELETLMIRIEAVINQRPITYVYDDHHEPKPLSPADFLIGPRSAQLPPYAGEDRKIIPATQQELTNRLKYQERLGEQLAARWTEEYLQERLLHTTVTNPQREIHLGEVVIIKDETANRPLWRMGSIIELFTGKDGVIISVRIKTAQGTYKRPVQNVCPLEIIPENPEISPKNEVKYKPGTKPEELTTTDDLPSGREQKQAGN